MKTCKDCQEQLPLDDFYMHWSYRTYDHRSSYCKRCVGKRSKVSTYRARAEQRVSIPKEPDESYIQRHTARRQVEAEWGASYLPSQSEPENLNDPKPVWRDLFYQFQRPQTKVSSWKA